MRARIVLFSPAVFQFRIMKWRFYRFEWRFSLALAGVIFWLGLQPQLHYLWWRWTSSGLRSLGLLITLASLYFCWHAWHHDASAEFTAEAEPWNG